MNIVRMVDRMKSENHYYLVLEFCNGRDLESYLKLTGCVSENIARTMIKQIVDGMNHLSGLNALH